MGAASGRGSPGGNKGPLLKCRPSSQPVAGGMRRPGWQHPAGRDLGCAGTGMLRSPGGSRPATVRGPWTSRCPPPLTPPAWYYFFFPLGDSSAEVPWKVARAQRSSDFTPRKRRSTAPASSPGAGHGAGGGSRGKHCSSCRILGEGCNEFPLCGCTASPLHFRDGGTWRRVPAVGHFEAP